MPTCASASSRSPPSTRARSSSSSSRGPRGRRRTRRSAARRCSVGGTRSSSASSRHRADERHAEVRRRGHQARRRSRRAATAPDVDVPPRRSAGSSSRERLALGRRGPAAPRLRLRAELAEGARAGRRSVPPRAVPTPVPAAIKAEADRIVAGAKDDAEKATQLFAFVSHDIRSIDLPLGWAGYEPHSPEVVLAEPLRRRSRQGRPASRARRVAEHQGPPGARAHRQGAGDRRGADARAVRSHDRQARRRQQRRVGRSERRARPVRRRVRGPGQPRPSARQGRRRARLAPGARSVDVGLAHQGAVHALAERRPRWRSTRTSSRAGTPTARPRELRPLKGELADRYFQQQAAGMSASALDKGHTVSDTLSVTGPVTVDTRRHAFPATRRRRRNMRVFELPPVTLGVADDEPSASLSARKTAMWVGVPRTERGDITVQIPRAGRSRTCRPSSPARPRA